MQINNWMQLGLFLLYANVMFSLTNSDTQSQDVVEMMGFLFSNIPKTITAIFLFISKIIK